MIAASELLTPLIIWRTVVNPLYVGGERGDIGPIKQCSGERNETLNTRDTTQDTGQDTPNISPSTTTQHGDGRSQDSVAVRGRGPRSPLHSLHRHLTCSGTKSSHQSSCDRRLSGSRQSRRKKAEYQFVFEYLCFNSEILLQADFAFLLSQRREC